MTTPPATPRTVELTPVQGRRALVVGLGAFGGGLGTARWLAEQGARVTVTDLRDETALEASVRGLADLDVDLILGEHRESDFAQADLVVANPAVPPRSKWLSIARTKGAEITSEVALFLERVPGRVLAVTGTHGKSSTVSMAQQLLVGGGRRAFVGGNIGGSLLGSLKGMEAGDTVVLELSSYQLEVLPSTPMRGHADSVAITNILADHLERHGDEDQYLAAKAGILRLVGAEGVAILPRDERRLPVVEARTLTHATAGHADLTIADGRFHCGDEILGNVADLQVSGTFQAGNALVALGLARVAGIPPESLAAQLPKITGLEHRLQDLGQRGGVHVIDNGVSTTPDSTEAVLRDVPTGSTLLVGGQAKRLPLDRLARAAQARGLRVFLFGASRDMLLEAFGATDVAVSAHATLPDAVAIALESTPRGGTLLFSPACASFDAFTNFRARAEAFRSLLPAVLPSGMPSGIPSGTTAHGKDDAPAPRTEPSEQQSCT